MLHKLLTLAILSTFCSLTLATDNAAKMKEVDALRLQGNSVKTITPIFSQLVMFSFPKGFAPASENAKGGHYIQESVLQGESIKEWSQIITITGAKGLAANPNLTPTRFAKMMAGAFKRACPNSFMTTDLGEIRIDNHEAFAAVTSCGVSASSVEPRSESMLLIVIEGQNDYYTIQWAERGDATDTPITFDNAKWMDRLKQLMPISLCPIVPGEQAPYPSCANRT